MSSATSIPVCPNPRFDEFQVGQKIAFETVFTGDEIEQFAKLSGDWNPLHVDAAYANRTPFRQRVVHGMLASSLFSRVAGMHFPGQQSLLLQVENVAFHGPILEDEPLRCEAELREIHKLFQILVIAVRITGRYGRLRVSGTIKVQYRQEKQATPALPQWETIMQTDLSNRVALVTGASRGIGAAIAAALGGCGAKVVVNYHTSAALADETAHRVEQAGGKAITVKANVAARDEVAALVKQATSQFGPIDLLVNNATAPVESLGFLETPWDLMERDFRIHVGGAYNCLQEVLPGMVEKKFGRIVSLLTVYLESPPPRGVGAYVTAKSALMGLTRTVAGEYGRYGIATNMVSPSVVETDLTADLDERAKKMIASRVPVGRLANPEDVVGPVLFLLSPAASYINGANFSVNGGLQF